MEIESLLNCKQNILSKCCVLFLVTLSFLVSDWNISSVTLSDFIMVLIIIIVLGSSGEKISEYCNYRLLFISVSLVLLHFFIQYIFNDSFAVKMGLYNTVRLIFYFNFIFFVYNYVRSNKLEKNLLIGLNLGAIFAIILGIVIIILLKIDSEVPQSYFWRFTRTDIFSYEYKRNPDIIRMRSVFAEPAHLGYFLNIVLGVNLFYKHRIKHSFLFIVIVIMGLIWTMSYATIAIMLVLIIIKIFMFVYYNKKNLGKTNLFIFIPGMILLAIGIFYYRDPLYETVINRTKMILEGEDKSALNRLYNSWTYVSKESLLFGKGIGHTPPIQNVYAYFLSDLGIFYFLLIVMFSIYLLIQNLGIGVLFVMLNFAKGGYLSPVFSLLILLLLIYTKDSYGQSYKK